MVSIEEMGDSAATAATNRTHSGDDFSRSGSEEDVNDIQFNPFLVTPNLVDVRKELKGTKNEPLSTVVASHPTYMKDAILGHGTKMLDSFFKICQKNEAQAKQNATTDNQASYIPGSLRSGNPIVVPNYLKGSTKLQKIVQEGHDLNDSKKEEFAAIARRMTQAVIEETGSRLREDIFNAIHELSQLYVVAWENSADEPLELKLSTEELASYATKIYLKTITKTDTSRFMGFQDTEDIATMYREHLRLDRVRTFQSKITDDGILLVKKVADSLEDLMDQLTYQLWKYHERKDRDRKMKSKMKEITVKFAAAKKNEEMQERIAKEEKEAREASARGELPATMKAQIQKCAKAEAKRMFDEYKKKERSKASGGTKNQESKPIKDGTKQKRNSAQTKSSSKKKSTEASKKQREKQKNTSRRSEANTGEKSRQRSNSNSSRSTSSNNSDQDSNNNSKKSNRTHQGRGGRGRGRGRGGRGGRGGRHSEKQGGRGKKN